jgi:outer membrane protein
MLIAAVLTAPVAMAQTPVRLTLDEAIALGLEAAPQLAEVRAREAAADQAVRAREALRAPTVNALAGYLRTNHVDEFGVPEPDGGLRVIFPDVPSNYRFRMEAVLPLYLGGRVDALVEAAEAEGRVVGADRQIVEEDLRLEIAEAYWGLVTALEAVDVVERSLARTDAWVGDVQARVDSGLLPPHEVLLAEAHRARQAVQLIEGQNLVALANITLARLIGGDPDVPIQPTTSVAVSTTQFVDVSGSTADGLIETALGRRAERAVLEAQRASLRATGRSAVADLRPQVSARLALEPARPNSRFVPRTDEWNTSWDLGVNLTWSFWDGGRAKATRATADAQADAVAERLRGFDDLVAVEVRARLLELTSSRAALVASVEGVAAAAEVRRVLDERFDVGVATSTEVLDAELALREAELERTRIQARIRVSEARLVRALGGQ